MKRYLALGDSYTIGEGVLPAERWPVQLRALLVKAGVAVEQPTIIARTGWTTDELDAAITSVAPVGVFDLVTLLIGVNDQYREYPLERYEAGFAGLLGRAIGFAGGAAGRVVVLSIPDWGVTPFAQGRDRAKIARAIDRFNVSSRQRTEAAGAHWVDVTAISRHDSGPAGVVADGLHPAGAEYAAWAAAAEPAARSALGVTPRH